MGKSLSSCADASSRSFSSPEQGGFFKITSRANLPLSEEIVGLGTRMLRVRFFGKIRKRICDPRSYGFFDTKETQNPKKDYFVRSRQAGGTQYICQNDISLVLPKNSTRM